MRQIRLLVLCFTSIVLTAPAIADEAAAEEATSAQEAAVSIGEASEGSPSAGPAFTIGAQPAWYILGGITGGGSVIADDRSGFIGGELSVVRLRDRSWMGAYIDGYYDFGIDGTYVTAGPEFGKSIIGVDIGGVVRFAGGAEFGATGRIIVGLGVLSLYGRYIYMNSDIDQHVVQAGLVFKLPLHSPFGAGAPR